MISTKVFSGYSCCFRQWRATHSHCQFLHGYGVSFKIWFEGELDERNWVADFGGFKGLKDFFSAHFDHTVIVADDDPKLMEFESMVEKGLIQLVTLPDVGCERFAEYVFVQADEFVKHATGGRVRVLQVEFKENERNSAICRREDVTTK